MPERAALQVFVLIFIFLQSVINQYNSQNYKKNYLVLSTLDNLFI